MVRGNISQKAYTWLKNHIWLTVFLICFLVIIPFFFGFSAYNFFNKNEKDIEIILSALVGWPNFPNSVSNGLIGWGVGFSAFAVFGIPTLLGAIVSILLENAERRLAERMKNYLKDRDDFIATEIYKAFRDKLKTENDKEECLQTARQAIKQANDAWFRDTEPPDPRAPMSK